MATLAHIPKHRTIGGEQGAVSLEFALVSPLIMLSVCLLGMVSLLGVAGLHAQGVAQSIARHVALTGAATIPEPYTVSIVPNHPREGEPFHVDLTHTLRLPLFDTTWPVRARAWAIRAPDPS